MRIYSEITYTFCPIRESVCSLTIFLPIFKLPYIFTSIRKRFCSSTTWLTIYNFSKIPRILFLITNNLPSPFTFLLFVYIKLPFVFSQPQRFHEHSATTSGYFFLICLKGHLAQLVQQRCL